MRYAHILLAFANELWGMERDKLDKIVGLLALQAAGEKFTDVEIEARIGRAPGTPAAGPVVASDPRVAILPIRGVISNRMNMMGDVSGPGGFSGERFARDFQAAVRDDRITAIVLDVDSPGGAVTGTDEISTMIYEARGAKPIIAHVNANMASCAYWIGTAADEVVVTPSGEVGAIGIFGVHDDVSAALEKLGVKKTLISAGKFKTEGNSFGPLSEEAQAHLQARVDEAYEAFASAVARNRGVEVSAVRNGFGQGRMVPAATAVTQGMADSVGTLDQVLQRFGVSLYAPAGASAGAGRQGFARERERRALEL